MAPDDDQVPAIYTPSPVGPIPELTGDSHNPKIRVEQRRGHGPTSDAYVTADQPRDTFLTTTELAKRLEMWPEQVYRWCVKWFGTLPEGRRGQGMGYRIPLDYEKVARAWQQVEGPPQTREWLKQTILADPKNWVVLVGNVGSMHYTVGEVVERATQVLSPAQDRKVPISILYVGDKEG